MRRCRTQGRQLLRELALAADPHLPAGRRLGCPLKKNESDLNDSIRVDLWVFELDDLMDLTFLADQLTQDASRFGTQERIRNTERKPAVHRKEVHGLFDEQDVKIELTGLRRAK